MNIQPLYSFLFLVLRSAIETSVNKPNIRSLSNGPGAAEKQKQVEPMHKQMESLHRTSLDRAKGAWSRFVTHGASRSSGTLLADVASRTSLPDLQTNGCRRQQTTDFRNKLTGLPDTGQYNQPRIVPQEISAFFRNWRISSDDRRNLNWEILKRRKLKHNTELPWRHSVNIWVHI